MNSNNQQHEFKVKFHVNYKFTERRVKYSLSAFPNLLHLCQRSSLCLGRAEAPLAVQALAIVCLKWL